MLIERTKKIPAIEHYDRDHLNHYTWSKKYQLDRWADSLLRLYILTPT